jgi:type IV secretory pathway VirB4 component
MPEPKQARRKINTSTQEYLDIAEIKDDTVIMKDGSLRAVLLVSSVNFALKSEDEQNAVVASYVGFLNNIDFTLQIVIQSRELNIDNYLDSLKQKEKEQTNELLKMQTTEYIEYIKELVNMGKIMSKRFYIVVPYSPSLDKKRGFFSSLLEALRPVFVLKIREETFLRYKGELSRRMEVVISGLSSMGLNTAPLDTESLIELFYNTYNPATSKNQPLIRTSELRVTPE